MSRFPNIPALKAATAQFIARPWAPSARGMLKLDKSHFKVDIPLLALSVEKKRTNEVLRDFGVCLLSFPRIRKVFPDPNNKENRLVCLTPVIEKEDLSEIPLELRTQLLAIGQVVKHSISLDYDYFSTDDIFTAILPMEDQTKSFEAVGHIAHVNLRAEHEEYKYIMGQVLLDKNKFITSVVNKLDTIDNTYRNFKMEVIAGIEDFNVEVSENNCIFKFDYSKVYWNSRLRAEHERLLDSFIDTTILPLEEKNLEGLSKKERRAEKEKIKKHEFSKYEEQAVCDMMAGVGPFSVPACKRGCFVYANDLNPSSYSSLTKNITLNKLNTNRIKPFNMDGRDFVKQLVKDIDNDIKLPSFTHVVMNLPAIAIEFLDVFRGLYANTKRKHHMPIINCYCFAPVDQPKEETLKRVASHLGPGLSSEELTVYNVRSISPKKDMICLSFKLPEKIAFDIEPAQKRTSDDDEAISDSANLKKLKVEI